MQRSVLFTVLSFFVLLASFFLAVPSVQAEVSYNGGAYINICGTGTAATTNSCNQGCDLATGTCTNSANSSYRVVKYTCNGRVADCRDNESGFLSSQSLGNPGCGKTVQLDVFTKDCRTLFGGWTCSDSDLKDYMVWYSGDCPNQPAPSPTANPTPSSSPRITPTPSSTPTAQRSTCEDLSVVGGQDALVPATVTLRARATDNQGSIQSYKFYFGDGKIEETSSPEITHKYEVSGTFTARVDIKDSRGNWKTSSSCQETVRVKSAPVESHKADCSDVTWEIDNNSKAPATAKFKVYGYDNKGSIQQYRVDFGNGIVKDSDGQSFEQRYEKAGTYSIKAYIKDSKGNWQGGDQNCARTLYINTEPLTQQPSTGTPTFLTITAGLSGAAGLATYLYAKKSAAKTTRRR